MHEPRFDFVEVVRPEGTMIEVRDRATGKLHTTIDPELFAYMLGRAEDDAQGQGKYGDGRGGR